MVSILSRSFRFLNRFSTFERYMKKKQLYLLGIITLLLFPLPTFVGLWFFEGISWQSIFEFEKFTPVPVVYGLVFGISYAFLALLIMRARVFDTIPVTIETMVKNMRLTIVDCLFLSLCAGIGEEILFRSGVQFYLGPILTSLLFVSIHGYLSIVKWRQSLYGLTVLPFILLLSYGFDFFGLWFAVAAHAAYDFVLFLSMTADPNE